MTEKTRKGMCPQITQMDADKGFSNRRERREQRKNSFFSVSSCSRLFPESAPICANLPAPLAHFIVLFHSAIPDLVAAGRAGPLVFGKGQFESGVAAKGLREFAQDPFPYLDEAEKKTMIAAESGLLRKFTELAFDEAAEMRWQESRPAEADNIDVGPTTETDLQGDLIEASGNPF